MKTWFNFQAKTADSAEVSIFDEIGMWGVTAKDFIACMKAHAGKTLTVCINSPGGSVFDALAIYNALRAHGSEVTVKVMGIAASAASLIAMAGDKIIMPENTFLMIHNPWSFAAGNADELRDTADTLDMIGSSLIKTYVARTGLSEEEIKQMLDAETWLNAADALAKGFATHVEPSLKVAASYDVERFPENIRAIFNAAADELDAQDAIVTVTIEETETGPDGETETTTTTVTTFSGDAADPEDVAGESDPIAPTNALADMIFAAATAFGLGEYSASVALHANVKTIEDAHAFLANAREVNALCALAKKSDMAPQMIRDGISYADARARIVDALAASADEQQTSSVMPSGTDLATAAGADVWAKILPKLAAQK